MDRRDPTVLAQGRFTEGHTKYLVAMGVRQDVERVAGVVNGKERGSGRQCYGLIQGVVPDAFGRFHKSCLAIRANVSYRGGFSGVTVKWLGFKV